MFGRRWSHLRYFVEDGDVYFSRIERDVIKKMMRGDMKAEIRKGLLVRARSVIDETLLDNDELKRMQQDGYCVRCILSQRLSTGLAEEAGVKLADAERFVKKWWTGERCPSGCSPSCGRVFGLSVMVFLAIFPCLNLLT